MTISQISTPTLLTKPQREELRAAIRRGLAGVRIPEPLRLSEWADQHFYLSSESSAIEGPWECLPFQRDIMDCISNDDVRIIDWIKCSRVGYTKILMAAAAYFIEHKKRSGIFYQPNDPDAKKFSKAEIDPVIRDVKPLREAYGGDPEKRGRKNTVHQKQFQSVILYILGGTSGSAYRGYTVDWVFYDELEAFPRDVDEEGDPVTLGDNRISNSPTPKSVRGSTPKLLHDSLIHQEAESARHLFRFQIVCIHCDQLQVMYFKNLHWQPGKPETVHYKCPHCEGPMLYSDLRAMLERGRWCTDDGFYIESGDLYDPEDLRVDWPRHIAFHIWAAYSPYFSWQELVEEFLEANERNKAGDHRKLKTVTNTRFAEPWEDEGERIEHSELYLRREPYTRPPADVLLLLCAVDVQDNRLELEVTGHREGYESWGIEYRVLYGDPTELEVWAELEAFITRTYTSEDGRKLKIRGVILDSGHLAPHVYRFYKRTSHPRVFVCKGMGGPDYPIVSAPQKRKSGRSKAAVPLFLYGTDICKTLVYKRLTVEEPGPGYQHFPETYDEDYFKGITAEKRVIRKRKGFDVVEWHKEFARNEPLDLRGMTNCLLEILNPDWQTMKPRAPEPPPGDPVSEPVNPAAYRTPRTRSRRRRLPRR